jgi:glycosyltransferase involved in cell wall biosynthesis
MSHTVSDLLSLVIPLLNERESLVPLFAEISEVARGLDLRVEVIFVDDGSKDGSWEIIRELAAADERVRGIRLRMNFGKAAALQAGFQTARGNTVITLDADLQDDPHEIPRFLAEIRNGIDVVSGWKRVRLDPWHKIYPSRIFNLLVSWLMGLHLHDHNCGMKAYRAEVLREISLYGELHRFIPILAASRGYKIGELAINHRPRKFGHSKYRWQRFIKGFLDLGTVHFVTKFGRRPQHLLGSYGLAAGCSGLLGMLAFTFVMAAGLRWGDNSTLLVGLLGFGCSIALILLAGQLLAAGLLAELVVARKKSEQEPFSIAERTPSKADSP